jgi:hypothetical protein
MNNGEQYLASLLQCWVASEAPLRPGLVRQTAEGEAGRKRTFKKIHTVEENIERFWIKLDRRNDDECWNWKAAIVVWRGHSTGKFYFAGKQWLAHRFSWVLHNGEIPKGLVVCHKCDNGLCCNPNHHFLGTNKDNTQDCISKGRFVGNHKGELNQDAKLTAEKVVAIRARYDSGLATMPQMAKEYGVCNSTITQVVKRLRWKHIP